MHCFFLRVLYTVNFVGFSAIWFQGVEGRTRMANRYPMFLRGGPVVGRREWMRHPMEDWSFRLKNMAPSNVQFCKRGRGEWGGGRDGGRVLILGFSRMFILVTRLF